tara:strand:+ start:254 stop:694 length:441 start_codon:yes stop_codon:yes gene_type:complete
MEMPLYLYLICHHRQDIKTHTYIGCTENFLKRLNQHNGIEPGGPRITKRAAGSWNPVLILRLKPSVKSKELKKEWKQSSRGLVSRIKKGMELAVKHKLPVIMPKTNRDDASSAPDVPILNYINNKWKGEKCDLSDQDWAYLLSNEF